MKKIILLFIVLLCAVVLLGCAKESEGLEFELNYDRESYSVSGIGTCTDTDVVIPSTYEGKPVTEISSSAFKDCVQITSVTIPNGVTSIYMGAFYACTSLKSISIPDSVTTIRLDAFGECTSLLYNEYDNAYYLGNRANPYAFLIKAKDQNITSCKINSKTIYIGNSAFQDCSRITSIDIPNSVTIIGVGSFRGCESLKSVIISDSVTSIGDYAFSDCSELVNVMIGNNVTKIDSYVFSGCSELVNVMIGNNVTNIGVGAFSHCSALTNVIIPDSVTSIEDSAFNGCSSLSYNKYDNAYYLGSNNNPYFALVKVESEDIIYCEINSNSKVICCGAFRNCDKIAGITIPNGVISIGNGAFASCGMLTSISIPDSVINIGRQAFIRCKITNLTIPENVTNIGEKAFASCGTLKSVTFNNPTGWSVDNGGAIINEEDLSDPSIAAKYLTDTYSNEPWVRN